jgi:phosphoglycerol transferase
LRTSISETRPIDDDTIEATKPPRWQRWGFPNPIDPLRESFLVVGVVAPVLFYVYRLWDAHPRVPFSYGGDGLSNAAYTKSIIDNGWYLFNPRLAAPFGSDWRDFPLGGENVHWLSLKILGLVTGNYAIANNAYFLLSFFLIALSSYFVARFLGFRILTSLVVGVIYAFLPYHAYRGESHLTRSVYYIVPLCVLVLLWAVEYRTEFVRSVDDRNRWRRGRIGFAIGVAIVLGGSDTQNAMFMVAILAVVAIVHAVRDRAWRPLAIAGVIVAATLGSLVANNASFIAARLERGANTAVANRPLKDQDYYGLRPINLLLPAPGHRVEALSKLSARSARAQVTNSETPGTSLGILTSIGLVWSVGAALALGLSARRRSASSEFVAKLGVLNVIAILIGAIGGLGFVLALAGFGMYRSWNRISLFIGFFSLIALAVGLDKAFDWLRARARGRGSGTAAVAGVAALLVVGGALDQTTPRYVPDYENTAVRFDIDATFYHDLEKMLPPAVPVFQLPVEPFPEAGPINEMPDYEEFAAYLHSKKLRWSYGGIKGRPEGDWQQNLSTNDPIALAGQVAAAGFQGVVIDRTGFADRADAILAAVAPFTGPPQLRSLDDRLLYLDLTGLRTRLQRELGADALAKSAQSVLGKTVQWKGFYRPEPLCGGARRWAMSRTPTIELDNTTQHASTANVSTSFEANPRATRITVRGPGFSEDVALHNGTGVWKRQIALPRGKTQLQFSLTGPKVDAPKDARTLQFSLLDYDLGGQLDSPVAAWARPFAPTCKPRS